MKIQEIQIERFGVWRGLRLPLASGGLNVLYGPNEAGKTTLMRAIRGVLYGYEAISSEFVADRWDASLRIELDDRMCDLRRTAEQGTRGRMLLTALDGGEAPEPSLRLLLAKVDRRVFENVFAVTLQELQELATLNDEQVAQHVYGISLGPGGQIILDALADVERQKGCLFDVDSDRGELADLLQADERLSAEVASLPAARQRHSECVRQCEAIQRDIAELKSRQAGIQSQLRGHLFLSRIWGPWTAAIKLNAELNALPSGEAFPENGVACLDSLDGKLATRQRQLSNQMAELQNLRNEFKQCKINPLILRHAATIQAIVDQRNWADQIDHKVRSLKQAAGELEREVGNRLIALGPHGTIERIEAADTSPAAQYILVSTARDFQMALARRSRLRRRLAQGSKDSQKRAAEISSQMKPLNGASLDDALAAARQRLIEIEELAQLHIKRSELVQRCRSLEVDRKLTVIRHKLPVWVIPILAIFAVCGIALAIIGIVHALSAHKIIGAGYFLLGVTGLGFSWAFKRQFEGERSEDASRLRATAMENEQLLAATGDAIGRLSASRSLAASQPSFDASPADNTSVSSLMRQATRHLCDLERLADRVQSLEDHRRLLTGLRARLQTARRDVGTTRHAWCELLTKLGFAETVHIGEALGTWQQVVEAVDARQRWVRTADELRAHTDMLDSFQQRARELWQKLERSGALEERTLGDVLDEWAAELQTHERNVVERRRLRLAVNKVQHRISRVQQGIDELEARRKELLAQAGAADRPEFLAIADGISKRSELQQLLELANAELEAARQTEPELAIAEEDLLEYDTKENRECIDILEGETQDLKQDLEDAFEKLGSLKQVIKELEDDRGAARVQFDHAQVGERLKRSAEQWLATEWACRLLEVMRTRFEKSSQPATLAAAIPYLTQLSSGKYRNIWTPLAKKHLCIDDDQQHSLRVEQLSNGTREQLFLAIRLALVREFARRGIELPLVLDDVIVNFDQQRTEAAVDTLLDFAKQGQQVLLFTCHLHLAQLFQSRGVEPIWLPSHAQLMEQRRAG